MATNLPPHLGASRQQRGVSLFIVLIVVVLSILLAIWTSRTALFNEMVLGNTADNERAYEAAQALLRDAELDIMGASPSGTRCKDSTPIGSCRPLGFSSTAAYFPRDTLEYGNLRAAIGTTSPSCIQGVCTNQRIPARFWDNPTQFANMTAVAATYGQFTEAKTGANSNPLLRSGTGETTRAWYWVEVLPYDVSTTLLGGNSYTFRPGAEPFAYRITAIAQGLKPASRVVLQTVVVIRERDS